MIQLIATAIHQQMDLNTGLFTNFVVLRLPNGEEFHAEVSASACDALLRLRGTPVEVRPTSALKDPPPQEDEEFDRSMFEHTVDEPHAQASTPLLNWSDLPDELVAPEIKKALRAVGAPAQMTGEALHTMITDIQERFSEEDWSAAMSSNISDAPPEQVAQAPVGVVEWQEGSVPRQQGQQGRPARTVACDEKGNPVVPGFVSRRVATDEDEFGASQV